MEVEEAKQRREAFAKWLLEIETRFLKKTPSKSFGLGANDKLGYFRAWSDVDGVGEESKAAVALAVDMARWRRPSIPIVWTLSVAF